MKLPGLLPILLVLAAGEAAAQTAAAPLPPSPELVSFADVYRLAVGAAEPQELAFAAAPLRVAAGRPASAEPRFSIRPASERERWLLFLSGFALAGWVAHRRLVSAL
jgi:hypothetical protein